MLKVDRRPTITDVARLCGVTPATVSRVLNAKKRFSTSVEVRERIHATAKKIGYVPDLAARNLNRGITHIVGVFASPHTHIAEGINEMLLEGVAQVMHPQGYDVFFELSPRGARNHELPFWRFDGAILMQAPRPETVIELDRRRVPYLCLNERVGTAIGYVLADDVGGMTQAVDHLAKMGHQRIAYTNIRDTYFKHYSVAERGETFFKVARKNGMTVVDGHEKLFPHLAPAEFIKQQVIEGKATAVVAYDHQIAVMVLSAASNMGLRIPQDFSLVCFNDMYPVAALPTPLTCIAVSGREMGRIGADLLLSWLKDGKIDTGPEVRVPEQLVQRASTAPPPKK
jgi:LacI family transcriptional regulator